MIDIGVVAGPHMFSGNVHGALDTRKDAGTAWVEGPIEVGGDPVVRG